MKTISYWTIICCCLAFAASQPALADSPLPEGTIVNTPFPSPQFEDKRLDWCLSWAKDCGKAAADAWCKAQGFELASKFEIDENIGKVSPTKIFSTGQSCDQDFCDGFKMIECRKFDCPAGAKEKCCYGKEC
ncbi:hypothetical protein [Candidatus Electronema sp. PJ]|uniref:hypothetical protein n=1 Tax=Candidatus Electronema sp. PJ TaxID=3401572 RepID=UPI003AA7BE57